MAKKVTMKADGEKNGVSPDALRKAIDEISRLKGLASEYAGLAGKATQQAVEQHGLDKTSLTFARRLNDMEDSKRDAVVTSSLDYWEKLGFLDGGLFNDDLIGRLEAIVTRYHNQKGGSNVTPLRSEADRAVDDKLLN